MAIINIISILACYTMAAICMKKMRDNQMDTMINGNFEAFMARDKWIFAGAVCFLIIIRLVGLGRVPDGYNQDTIMAAVDAKALAECGTDRFGTRYPVMFEAWGYGQMSVLMSYCMVPFLKLGGTNLLTVSLPCFLASIMGALAVYGFARNVFGVKAANVILCFLAINPWHFMQSRWALDCNMFPHMFVCGFCFLNLFMSNKRKWYLCVSMIFFAFCMYSYGEAFITVPIFLVSICLFLLLKKKVRWKEIWLAVFVYGILSWPIYLCMIINTLKLNTINTPFFVIQRFSENVRSNDILFFSEQPLLQLWENIKSLIYVAFYRDDDLLYNCVPNFGTIFRCTLPFVFLGIIVVLYQLKMNKKETTKNGCIALLLFYFASICTGLIISRVNINRINIIFYEHIIFAGIGIYAVWKYLKTFGRGSMTVIYATLFICFMVIYFTEWKTTFENRFHKDMMEAIEYAAQINADKYYMEEMDIYTIYGFDMDIAYFQGKTDIYMGKEIPYKERFYHGILNQSPDEKKADDEEIVYVQRQEQKAAYRWTNYKIVDFDDWFVAISKY